MNTYTIPGIAKRAGLSESIIRRDVRLGYLKLETPGWIKIKHYKGLATDQQIEEWLNGPQIRCTGFLNFECRQWLGEIGK